MTVKKLHINHGLRKHPLYSVWINMKQRCYNKNSPHYNSYGGRGVVVCDQWLNSFKSFYDWAIINGYENGLELDKDKLSEFKVGIIYSPNFCCFLTHKNNTEHTEKSLMITYIGQTKNLSVWASELALDYSLVRRRIRKLGWSIEKAFNTPSLKPNKRIKKAA